MTDVFTVDVALLGNLKDALDLMPRTNRFTGVCSKYTVAQ